jgi:hypothetical protein
MNKITHAIITILVLITSLISPLLQSERVEAATGTTVGTSTIGTGTYQPYGQKTFYADTRYWVMYSNGTNGGFTNSTDLSSWHSFISIGAASQGAYVSSIFDGTHLHYLRYASSKYNYRMGTPDSSGNITWSAAEQVGVNPTLNNSDGTFSIDTSGHIYITQGSSTGTNATITKNANTDGTWSTAIGYPLALKNYGSGVYPVARVVQLTNDKMYALYYAGAGGTIYGKYYNGANWGAEETVSSYATSGTRVGVTSIGDTVEVVYLRSSNGQIRSCTRNSSTGAWSEVAVVTSSDAAVYPVLSAVGNDLMVAYPNSTNKHVYYAKRISGTWSSAVDWLDESADSFSGTQGFVISSSANSRVVSLVYTTKTSNPYNVKIAQVYVPSLPVVTSSAASSITVNAARINGDLTDSGGENSTITAYYGASDGGTTPASWTYNCAPTSPAQPQGVASFYADISSLTSGQKYYFKFKAVNSSGTAWSSTLNFTTLLLATVTTSAVSSITTTTALINGNITVAGSSNSTVTIHWGTSDGGTNALNWSNNSSPSSPAQPQGVAAFSKTITGLPVATTIYFTASATNIAGTSWSATRSFVTYDLVSVSTQAATVTGNTTATGNGNITNIGRLNADQRGFEWDINTGSPYSNNVTVSGNFTAGAYTLGITGLPAGTLIYYRSMAHNADGWGYGAEATFITYGPPTVTTGATGGIGSVIALLYGNITNLNGGVSCAERGFVYDTISRGSPGARDPATSGYSTVSSESGIYPIGVYSRQVTSLIQGTNYYYRAYAKNAYGYSYGAEATFITQEKVVEIIWQLGTTFTDLTGNGNDATASYRVITTDPNITASIISQNSQTSSIGPSVVESAAWSLLTDEEKERLKLAPSGLFTGGGTNFPGGDTVGKDAATSGETLEFWLGLIAASTSIGLGIYVFAKSHRPEKGAKGSIFLMCATIEGMLIVWYLIGREVGTENGVIPGWWLIPFGVASIFLLFTKNTYNPYT